MLAFHRVDDHAVCRFEPAEINLLRGLIGQLIELLIESAPPVNGPGTARLPQEFVVESDATAGDDEVFERLEREMVSEDDFNDEPSNDPVLKRLFPDPYPDDPSAGYDFQRFTHAAQLDDKVTTARVVLADLDAIADDGRCAVCGTHTMGWLKTLTNLRLALAARLDIRNGDDADQIGELPDDDPRSWTFSIYEWLGWVQESLLNAQDE